MNNPQEQIPDFSAIATAHNIEKYLLEKKIDDLDLSGRSSNCLKRAGIIYVGELVQRTDAELFRYDNFGRRSLNNVKQSLMKDGLRLGMKLPDAAVKINEAAAKINNAIAREDEVIKSARARKKSLEWQRDQGPALKDSILGDMEKAGIDLTVHVKARVDLLIEFAATQLKL